MSQFGADKLIYNILYTKCFDGLHEKAVPSDTVDCVPRKYFVLKT